MATAPDAGQLLAMFLGLVKAKKTIEIGVFTGYSLLLAALTIPDNGSIHHKSEGTFDFAYVDEDKENNLNYHERLLKLVRVGGVIAYDNTLWAGLVAVPEESVPEFTKPRRKVMIEFNKLLAADPRIQISQVPVGDGTTFCLRIH